MNERKMTLVGGKEVFRVEPAPTISDKDRDQVAGLTADKLLEIVRERLAKHAVERELVALASNSVAA